jgi:hypothetical protein
VRPRPSVRETIIGLAPINLGRAARPMHLRDEHLRDRLPELAAALADVITNRCLRVIDAMLITGRRLIRFAV